MGQQKAEIHGPTIKAANKSFQPSLNDIRWHGLCHNPSPVVPTRLKSLRVTGCFQSYYFATECLVQLFS